MSKTLVDLPDHILSIIADLAERYPAIDEIILFGSRALGNAKHGSDIDIALSGRDVDSRTVMDFHAYLEEETDIPHFFDVVHLESVDEGLKRHILENGKSIYTKRK